MKKILLLSAAILVLQAVPAFAGQGSGPSCEGGGPCDGRAQGGKNVMFAHHDTNKDGNITEAEFLASAKERFKKMDANSDGKVTKEEARSAHEKMREEMKERRDQRRSENRDEEKQTGSSPNN